MNAVNLKVTKVNPSEEPSVELAAGLLFGMPASDAAGGDWTVRRGPSGDEGRLGMIVDKECCSGIVFVRTDVSGVARFRK